MIDLTPYADNELSIQVFQDALLYEMIPTRVALLDFVKEMFKYSKEQHEVLILDLNIEDAINSPPTAQNFYFEHRIDLKTYDNYALIDVVNEDPDLLSMVGTEALGAILDHHYLYTAAQLNELKEAF